VPTPSSRKASTSKSAAPAAAAAAKPEHKILFQKFIKSIGPRTYVSQIKEAANGNHFLVLTEGKRDPETDEVRKTRLFIYSEDFVEFFRMLQETIVWIKANPVPAEVKDRRERYWAKQSAVSKASPHVAHSPAKNTLKRK
jgi:hypothetical protein